jgi:hypothetical protein
MPQKAIVLIMKKVDKSPGIYYNMPMKKSSGFLPSNGIFVWYLF